MFLASKNVKLAQNEPGLFRGKIFLTKAKKLITRNIYQKSRPCDSYNVCRHFLYSSSQFFQALHSKMLHCEIAIIMNLVLFLFQLQKMKEKKGLYPDKSVYTQQVGPGCCFGALALMLRFYFEVINITVCCTVCLLRQCLNKHTEGSVKNSKGD